MRHLKKGRKFGRTADRRRAFMKSLLAALVLKERIKTTEARAKELRPKIEKLITRAKSATIAARRAIAGGTSPAVAKKLIETIAPRYKERNGGYARIIKAGIRRSDAARLAIIEFV